MAIIPTSLARVPNILQSQMLLGGITRTNLDLLSIQSQMASGRRVNSFSDDPIAASAISVTNGRLAQGSQVLQNLSSARNSLSFLDTSLGDATSLVQEAKSVASSQIGTGSDAATRNNQAVVVDGMIRSLLQISNRSSNGIYLFGGSTATQPPIVEARGGYRYVGRGSGLFAELGSAADVPISIGGDNAIGESSARIRGVVDLNPGLSSGARLSDIRGARSLGIPKGSVQFSFGTGPTATVDLSTADTAGDVVNMLTGAIRQYETTNGVTILGPGGVSLSGGSIRIDVPSAGPPNLVFGDPGVGTTAADLGLSQQVFNATSSTGADVNPRMTLLTPVAALAGVTIPLGSIRFRFSSAAGSSITDVNLASAQTIDDVRNLIETQVPGVRLQINAAATSLDIFNEIAGPALSIEPTGSGPDVASQLGIRSMALQTRMADFNDGRGVAVVDGRVDPVSGSATRAANTDFRIVLGNGQAFDVDLRPQDMVDVTSLLNRINAEFASALTQPPVVGTAPPLAAGQFAADLNPNGSGIRMVQNLTGTPSAIRVEKLNNSGAAEDLGFLGGIYDGASASLVAQDRAAVRVDNIFTALVRLRDALQQNDSTGISLAGSGLDAQVDRLAQAQALVGVYSQRVEKAQVRQEDENIMSEQYRSQLQDTDFSEATVRFNLLRTQLEATLRSGSLSSNLTLLDFLR